ncbi:MAG: phosphoglycerate kinase [bacterium]|nr:phosphoglycerate kinase [bacterium]
MNKLCVSDIEVKGKRVLVRVDFNVPQDENGNITDDTRIRASLPTIQYIIEKGGKAILMSHLGRPKGKVDDKYRLTPIGKRLSELLGKPVLKLDDCIGPQVESAVNAMKDGEVALLENLRFYAEEEKNDPGFAQKLAKLGEVYVNDAFGSAHRAHASTEGVAKYLQPAVAGFLMKKEIDYLGKALENPARPFIAILGGAKVSSKIGVVKNLLNKVDCLIIGGGMTYTFVKAQGGSIGTSLVEEEQIPLAKEILAKAIEKSVPLLLPIDHIVADKFAPDANVQTVVRGGIPEGWIGVDIGPATIEKFAIEIRKAKTIVWNGPLGVFEMEPFANGTNALAKLVGESGAVTIIGGGDSIAALEKAGYIAQMSHVSTGGGASLEFLEGIELPGLAALTDKT